MRNSTDFRNRHRIAYRRLRGTTSVPALQRLMTVGPGFGLYATDAGLMCGSILHTGQFIGDAVDIGHIALNSFGESLARVWYSEPASEEQLEQLAEYLEREAVQ